MYLHLDGEFLHLEGRRLACLWTRHDFDLEYAKNGIISKFAAKHDKAEPEQVPPALENLVRERSNHALAQKKFPDHSLQRQRFTMDPSSRHLLVRDRDSKRFATDGLPLQVMEWYASCQPTGSVNNFSSAASWIQHESRSLSSLRIVFAPYHPESHPQSEDLNLLLQHYLVPSEVTADRHQSVTHSFGSLKLNSKIGVDLAWCHFLSKDLAVQEIDGSRRIIENGNLKNQSSQANSSWITSDYIIHTHRSSAPDPNLPDQCVTLLCFGAHGRVMERFKCLLNQPMWREVTKEPYVLFMWIYQELAYLIDDTAWALADAFRPVEHSTLEGAQDRDSTYTPVDFPGLHNAFKHCTYLLEAVRAASKTLDAMSDQLESTASSDLAKGTVDSLRYRKRTFQSTALRLESLEKRMSNIISLSFHLVGQANNNVMREDSRIMKTIAVMTLIFLPATGVASVFSSPFFTVDSSKNAESLSVATSFWIFWAFTIPLTAAVVLLWWKWFKSSKRGRFFGQNLRPNDTPC